MPNLYEQLGEQMSSAIEYGAKGSRFWELDQIKQMYDVKRKRRERLFNNLGYGIEAATRISDIHQRNQRLEDFATKRSYEVDTGFLGIGTPEYKFKDDLGGEFKRDISDIFDMGELGESINWGGNE